MRNNVIVEKMYNLTKLREMLDGNEDAVMIMVNKFIKTIPVFLTELNDNIKAGDLERVKKVLYNINFSLDILGIHELKDELRFIEQITSDKSRHNELKLLMNKLNTTCNRV